MIIIKKCLLLLYLYIEYIIILDIYYCDCVCMYETIYFFIKKNMMCQVTKGMFNYRIKFKSN